MTLFSFDISFHLQKITEDEFDSLVAQVMRYIFIKGCAKEPILFKNLNEDVLGEKYRKISGLNKDLFLKAKTNLSETFGFKIVEAPRKLFPQQRFNGCYFMVS